MKRRLLTFNCSNDMALAEGRAGYTPPSMIRRMEAELSFLPFWWAFDGDAVVVSDADEALSFHGKLEEQLRNYGICLPKVRFLTHEDISGLDDKTVCADYEPMPWGWSRTIHHQLLSDGIRESAMPSLSWIDDVRKLSNRKTAVEYIRRLHDKFTDKELIGQDMAFVTSISSLDDYIRKADFDLIMKSPWSSSGKGINIVETGNMDASKRQWAQNVIKRQGGLCIDRYWRGKQTDFAMEYEIEDGKCRFLGYSLFVADDEGKYQCNVIGKQTEIRNRIIESGCDSSLLDAIADFNASEFQRLFGDKYLGVIGVDMLLARDSAGRIRIHPCVEINFRMNMGVLAMKVAERLMPEAFADSLSCKNDSDCHDIPFEKTAMIPLTPPRETGFNAYIKDGKMFIDFR